MNTLLSIYSIKDLINFMKESANDHFLYKDGRSLFAIEDTEFLDREDFQEHPYYPLKISNLGRVMQKNIILHQFPDETKRYPFGYLQVKFKNHTKRFKTEYVYRLVAETWCKNPDRSLYTDVHHIINNGTNNTAENLIWLTCEQHAEIHPFIKNTKRYKDCIMKNKL